MQSCFLEPRLTLDLQISCAAVRNNAQPDTANWADKYLGIIDFNSIVPYMMTQTWGRAPASLEELRLLKGSFQSTSVSQLFGLLEFWTRPYLVC